MTIADLSNLAEQGAQANEKIRMEKRREKKRVQREEKRKNNLRDKIEDTLRATLAPLEMVRGGYHNDKTYKSLSLHLERSGTAPQFTVQADDLKYSLLEVSARLVSPEGEKEKTQPEITVRFRSDNTKVMVLEGSGVKEYYYTGATTKARKKFSSIGEAMEEVLKILAPSCTAESVEKAGRESIVR